MPSYKLTYFDLRYLGEGPRLIFHQAGVPYEDIRLKPEDWIPLKPKTPFGQLPILEVNGEMISQSHAICRYLAHQFGLAGKTPMEEALIDSIADGHKDFFNECSPYFLILGGHKKGDKDAIYKETVVPARNKYLVALEKFLAKSGSGFLVGKSLTWVDLIVTEYIATWDSINPTFLHGHPKVKKYVQSIRALPNIKKWIEERPNTIF
uniref:glutathione transferase n=1 Tax=Ascaris lumbricoides TaxID=6252 RepID=A0A0M3HSZ2_ASCLU